MYTFLLAIVTNRRNSHHRPPNKKKKRKEEYIDIYIVINVFISLYLCDNSINGYRELSELGVILVQEDLLLRNSRELEACTLKRV